MRESFSVPSSKHEAPESGAHNVAKDRSSRSSNEVNEMDAMFAELAEEFGASRPETSSLEADIPVVVDDEFDPTQQVQDSTGIREQIARVKARESRIEGRAKQRQEARLARKQRTNLERADQAAEEVIQEMARSRADKQERAKNKAKAEVNASTQFKRTFPLGKKTDVAIGAPEHINGVPVQRLDSSLLEDWEEPVVKPRRAIPEIPKLKTSSRPEAPRKSSVPELPTFVKVAREKNRRAVAIEAPPVLIKDRAAIGAPPVPKKKEVMTEEDGTEELDDAYLAENMREVVELPSSVLQPVPPPVPEKAKSPLRQILGGLRNLFSGGKRAA